MAKRHFARKFQNPNQLEQWLEALSESGTYAVRLESMTLEGASMWAVAVRWLPQTGIPRHTPGDSSQPEPWTEPVINADDVV